MFKDVELSPTPKIKVEVDTLNLIMQLGKLSSHKD
jgi:hypothetical protein